MSYSSNGYKSSKSHGSHGSHHDSFSEDDQTDVIRQNYERKISHLEVRIQEYEEKIDQHDEVIIDYKKQIVALEGNIHHLTSKCKSQETRIHESEEE